MLTYIQALQNGAGTTEYERLVDLLTVNETYFFREEEHFQLLLGELWPEWTRSGTATIRIWSAGCSTGCEAYTLAMFLKEKGLVGPGRPSVEILATDVNSRVLQEGREGLYADFSLRATTPYYRQKYFTRERHMFRLDPEIRSMVTFRRCNLLRPEPPLEPSRFHAIFCRNVLIYFDVEAKRRVVENLTRSLATGGVLLVGRSESLFNVPGAPALVSLGGILVHRKQDEGTAVSGFGPFRNG
ncbi:MAG: protein-glutamate O-methyltransferase CheR [Deltaproteobacteria bacterium]|nr:protein-glutamate O-methyltransferase CheR [Deltaproteobacteria bacterium]